MFGFGVGGLIVPLLAQTGIHSYSASCFRCLLWAGLPVSARGLVMWRRSGVHERAFTNEVDDAFGYKASIQEQAEIAMMKNDAFCLARYARKIASYKQDSSLCKVSQIAPRLLIAVLKCLREVDEGRESLGLLLNPQTLACVLVNKPRDRHQCH